MRTFSLELQVQQGADPIRIDLGDDLEGAIRVFQALAPVDALASVTLATGTYEEPARQQSEAPKPAEQAKQQARPGGHPSAARAGR